MRALTIVLPVLLLAACREGTARAPRDRGAPMRAALTVPAMTAAATAEAPSAPWREGEALTFDASPQASLELEAACSDRTLAVTWRAGRTLSVATRSLRDDGRWSEAHTVASDATVLGRPRVEGRAVWLAWSTATEALRAAKVEGATVRVREAPALMRAHVEGAFVLDAQGDHALVAATVRTHAGERVALVRVGDGAGATELGEGAVVAARGGAHPTLVALRNVPRSAGGPWHLQAWHVDTARALAMAPPRAPSPWSATPEGAATAGERVPIGVGRFEFARQLAGPANALFFQTVMGAERGVPRVAWFPSGWAPLVVPLPVAVTSVGAAFDDAQADAGLQRVVLTYWGDHLGLERATATPSGLGASTRIGPAQRDEFAVYDLAKRTRQVECGGRAYRLEYTREGRTVRLDARPEALR